MSALRAALLVSFAVLVTATIASAQSSTDPFPVSLEDSAETIAVNFEEFATIPDVGGDPPRLMHLVPEPGSDALFVSDMRGIIYRVGADGQSVTPYLDLRAAQWGVAVEAGGRERGLQSFAFHPDFNTEGAAGHGKFYTWMDSNDTQADADYSAAGADDTAHHTALMEWTAGVPEAGAYDGEAPRTVLRVAQPYGNHNGGQLAFNPLVESGEPDYGALYIGIGDGGSGGDPLGSAQNLGSIFGKILRIDPLGTNGPSGEYGIPADNPFANQDGALSEIYAYGLRNPQRLGWDAANGNMFAADIGQNIVEEVGLVPRGGNLGWNTWEGSFRYEGRSGVGIGDSRSDPSVTYPVAEYGQSDPLLQSGAAATGVHVHRSGEIAALQGLLIFGDMPSGEIFYVSADDLPDGGQSPIGRVLLNHDGQPRTLLEVIRAKNGEQGRDPASRADMRMATGPGDRLFLLNKADGVLRVLAP